LGLKLYFTGEPCKRGHVCERAVRKSNDCVECRREGQARHYQANKEAIGAKVAAYKKAKPEMVRRWAKNRWDNLSPEQQKKEFERAAAWSKANPERRRQAERIAGRKRRAKAKAENPALLSARKAAEHIKHRQKNNDRNKRWKRANPDKVQASNSRRRAIALGSGGSHTAADIKEIFELQNKRCAYCRKSLVRVGTRGRHVDHITPLTKGGHDGRSNLQILCQRCNNRKHAKRPEAFARELGMLL
jgi:5-methylcytosine-specific restriction endonuclease McrA